MKVRTKGTDLTGHETMTRKLVEQLEQLERWFAGCEDRFTTEHKRLVEMIDAKQKANSGPKDKRFGRPVSRDAQSG